MDKLTMLADIIEPSLSGQYGRDTAESVAEECLQVLGMKAPMKWQIGIYSPDRNEINWGWGGFGYADTAEQVLNNREDQTAWILKSFGPGHTLHARPFPEEKA